MGCLKLLVFELVPGCDSAPQVWHLLGETSRSAGFPNISYVKSYLTHFHA